jgi:GntR family transcriptional regulator
MQLNPSDIAKHSAVPLYLQIRNLLLQAIKQGELQPHQQAPSEREISELTGVSRMTVRQALQSLIGDGWLYTVPGKGTFVTDGPKIVQNLQRLSGLTQLLQSQGFTPSSRVIKLAVIPAGDREAEVFGVLPGTPLIALTRIRLANGMPVALESTHLVQARFPGLEEVDLSKGSLYDILQTVYGVYPRRAIQMIEADKADEMTAGLLDIAPHEPVLAMERITYNTENQPVEYVLSWYRADRSRLRVELTTGDGPRTGSVADVLVAPGAPRRLPEPSEADGRVTVPL